MAAAAPGLLAGERYVGVRVRGVVMMIGVRLVLEPALVPIHSVVPVLHGAGVLLGRRVGERHGVGMLLGHRAAERHGAVPTRVGIRVTEGAPETARSVDQLSGGLLGDLILDRFRPRHLVEIVR